MLWRSFYMKTKREHKALIINKQNSLGVTCVWDCCYMSHGTRLQIRWNEVTDDMEQGYSSQVTRREL